MQTDRKTYTLIDSFSSPQVATGRWQNSVNSTGWTLFEVETKAIVEPGLQAYAAGYLEGEFSVPRVSAK